MCEMCDKIVTIALPLLIQPNEYLHYWKTPNIFKNQVLCFWSTLECFVPRFCIICSLTCFMFLDLFRKNHHDRKGQVKASKVGSLNPCFLASIVKQKQYILRMIEEISSTHKHLRDTDIRVLIIYLIDLFGSYKNQIDCGRSWQNTINNRHFQMRFLW